MIRPSPKIQYMDPAGVHTPSRWSLRYPSLSSEVVALDVFRHHHTGSGKRSGNMSPPFILQQQIHPHFNPTSHNTPLLLPLLSVLYRLVGLLARCSLTHPYQLSFCFHCWSRRRRWCTCTFPLLLKTCQISNHERHTHDVACAANEKQQQLYFPPRHMQMMYSTTYNCATD